MKLRKSVWFTKGPSPHKYTAHIPTPSGQIRKVRFGNQNYEHYKDMVPKSQGGKQWSHKDHMNKQRRRNYRARHGAIRTKSGKKAYRVPYSAAWFSWHFLW